MSFYACGAEVYVDTFHADKSLTRERIHLTSITAYTAMMFGQCLILDRDLLPGGEECRLFVAKAQEAMTE